uniref:Putative ecdysteroid kinase n=1 Tax=Xenopsylla cheopis TaxID=163159 RepID=A0A6M2DEQ6_XENCH
MEVFNLTVRGALKKVIKNIGFEKYDVNVTLASKPGDNYGGTLHRIEITGQKQESKVTYYLICKIPIENFKLNLALAFQREVHVYQNILKAFAEFQEEKGLEDRKKFSSYVHCYDAGLTEGSEFIIMDDLTSQSYVMLNKLSNLDRQHVQLVVKALAEFHALSFTLKYQKPERFEEISNIPEVLIGVLSEKAFLDMLDFGLEQAILAVDELLGNKVMKVKENLKEIISEFLNGVGTDNYRVINHADCWNNNTMFKYENDTPVQVCLFDWQLSRLCSPVVDLVNYFYNSTEREILEDHFDDLMAMYHMHLSEFIATLGSDPSVLYPYEQFEKDLRKYAVFPFIACCSNLFILLSDPDKPPQFNDMAEGGEKNVENVLAFQDDKRKSLYNVRISCIIKHAADRGFI